MPDVIATAIIEIRVSKKGIQTSTKAGPGIQYSHILTGIELEKHKIIEQMLGTGRPDFAPTFNVRDLNSESGVN